GHHYSHVCTLQLRIGVAVVAAAGQELDGTLEPQRYCPRRLPADSSRGGVAVGGGDWTHRCIGDLAGRNHTAALVAAAVHQRNHADRVPDPSEHFDGCRLETACESYP